jgi:hypothetical protein
LRSGWTRPSIGRLLRCSWEVDAIVARLVVDHIDDSRLDNLYRIGVSPAPLPALAYLGAAHTFQYVRVPYVEYRARFRSS